MTNTLLKSCEGLLGDSDAHNSTKQPKIVRNRRQQPLINQQLKCDLATTNQGVVGSIPASRTIKINGLRERSRGPFSFAAGRGTSWETSLQGWSPEGCAVSRLRRQCMSGWRLDPDRHPHLLPRFPAVLLQVNAAEFHDALVVDSTSLPRVLRPRHERSLRSVCTGASLVSISLGVPERLGCDSPSLVIAQPRVGIGERRGACRCPGTQRRRPTLP